MFELTKHAKAQMQRRGIPMLAVELLIDFGKLEFAKGAERFSFDKKARKKLAAYFGPLSLPDGLLNMYLVVSGNKIISVGHRTKRFAWGGAS